MVRWAVFHRLLQEDSDQERNCKSEWILLVRQSRLTGRQAPGRDSGRKKAYLGQSFLLLPEG